MRVESSLSPALERPPGRENIQKPKDGDASRSYSDDERSKAGQQAPHRERGSASSERLKLHRSISELKRQELKERLALNGDNLKDEESLIEDLKQSLEDLNDEAQKKFLSLRFKLHEDSERWMVQVVDVLEDEVINEIPPEKILDISARISKMIGVMLDQRR